MIDLCITNYLNNKIKILFFTYLTVIITFVNLQCIPIDDDDDGLNYIRNNNSTPTEYIIVDSDILVIKESFLLSIRTPDNTNDHRRLWPNKRIPYAFHQCNVFDSILT